MSIPTKIYVSATLFNRVIKERQSNTGEQSRLGLLLRNKAGVCVDWFELSQTDEYGCTHMPGIEDAEIVQTYLFLAKKYPTKTVMGFAYITSNEGDHSLINGGDTGGDLWKHRDVPFVIFSPESTIAEMYDSKKEDHFTIEVAVVDDKYKAVKAVKKVAKRNKTTLAKAGSKRKTTRTKVQK